MKRIGLIVLLGLFTLALAAQPWADRLRDGEGPRGDWKEELGVTDEQWDQIHDLRVNNQKEAIELNAAIKRMEIEKREAFMDEDFSTIHSLIDQIHDKRAQLEKNRVTTEEKILKLLNEEQREKYKRYMLARLHRKGNAPGHDKPMGRGPAHGAGQGHHGGGRW